MNVVPEVALEFLWPGPNRFLWSPQLSLLISKDDPKMMSTGWVRGRDGTLALTFMIKAQLDWIPVHQSVSGLRYRLTTSPNSAYPVPIHTKIAQWQQLSMVIKCPNHETWPAKRLGNVIRSSKHTIIMRLRPCHDRLQQEARRIFYARSVVVKSPEWSNASVELITHHNTMPLLYFSLSRPNSSVNQLRFHFTRCVTCPSDPAGHFKVVSWTSQILLKRRLWGGEKKYRAVKHA